MTAAGIQSIGRIFFHYLMWRVKQHPPHAKGYLRLGDGILHYQVFGTGFPVLLLHGGLSRPISWFAQIPVLVECGLQVILVATRGHGLSHFRQINADYWLYADDVARISEHLDLEQVHIVGWSDGGNTGLHFALRYPQRLAKLVVISGNYHHEGIGLSQSGLPAGQTGWGWLYRLWLGAGVQHGQLVAAIHDLWQTEPRLDQQTLSRINHQVLVISGSEDCVSFDHCEVLSDVLPYGRHVQIAGGGHATPLTHHEQINHLLKEYLCDSPIGERYSPS